MQYEKLPAMFQTVSLWRQIAVSIVLNWIVGPFVRQEDRFRPVLQRTDCLDHAGCRMGYIA